jgi:transposase
MSGIEITRVDLSASELRMASAKAANARSARRMLALALVLEGVDRKTCGMDRRTLRDWVHRYNAEGLPGLTNRSYAGVPRRLSAGDLAELAALVEKGPNPETDCVVRWRRIDLQRVIQERFGVAMHERTVGKQLRALGFVKLTARARHPNSDPEAQEAFKKTLPTRSKPSFPNAPVANPSRSGSRTKLASANRAP